MNEIIIGQAAIASALWIVIEAIKKAFTLPSKVTPLLAIILGTIAYFFAGPTLGLDDPVARVIAGIISGGAAIGLNSGVKATIK
jgi:hypothetical protein